MLISGYMKVYVCIKVSPLCDTFFCGLAFLASASYFPLYKNYSFVENCDVGRSMDRGRRPNWLINQTSNAHNGHASPESKFEPGQEPPLRGIRTSITMGWALGWCYGYGDHLPGPRRPQLSELCVTHKCEPESEPTR